MCLTFQTLMKIKVGELRSLLHHGPDHVQLTLRCNSFSECKGLHFHENFREIDFTKFFMKFDFTEFLISYVLDRRVRDYVTNRFVHEYVLE